MATVTWTPYANGVSLLTLRTNINTFNTAVVTDITANETAIAGLNTSKITKTDTGILFATGSGAITGQGLTTSYAKVKMVDTTSVDAINAHASISYTTDILTVATTGIYKIRFSGAMTAGNGSVVEFNYNVNSVSQLSNPPQFLGRGASPVAIENSVVLSLTAGATVYIEAKCDSTTTMTPLGCGISVEKTHY